MKKLLFLLVLCCAAVACEKEGHFDFPEVGELDPNTANGLYMVVKNTNVFYENGIPVRFGEPEEMNSYNPSTVNIYGYLRVEDGVLDMLHEYHCTKCNDKKVFCWEYYNSPIDLQNRLVWQGSMEIYKFTNDQIILIKPMEKAAKSDNQSFWRNYIVYERTTPTANFNSITYIKHSDNPFEREDVDFCKDFNCKQQ